MPETPTRTEDRPSGSRLIRTPTAALRADRESSENRNRVICVEQFTVRYGDYAAIRNVSLHILANQVTAMIGPSGCGKSTLLRSLNRMNDLIPGVSFDGSVIYGGRDIYAQRMDAVELRRRIGMVFQRPNPFPKSIFKNVIWGAQVNGFRGNKQDLAERCLRRAALWDEVKDDLHRSAYELSGGQQQRLCIARAIALEPEVLLMDEPCSALDPIATSRIEDLIDELKKHYTVVLVTHNMQQAARVADRTAFIDLGELVEISDTNLLFTNPARQRTQDYLSGRFG